MGDTVVIELSSEQGTPYAWRVGPDLDTSVLSPLDEGRFLADLVPTAEGEPLPGTFDFRARAAKGTPSGPVSLELLYARTWDEEPTYRVMVTALVR